MPTPKSDEPDDLEAEVQEQLQTELAKTYRFTAKELRAEVRRQLLQRIAKQLAAREFTNKGGGGKFELFS
jgi:hypothetical protein